MITSTTNEIIKQLTAKIDSEKFTTDFINVLQTKLLDANSPYSDPFLKKFDDLFDNIIKDAEKRRDKKEDAKEKEEQQGYNSMSQDQETIIDQLKAENKTLKDDYDGIYKELVQAEKRLNDMPEFVKDELVVGNNGSTTTIREKDTDDEKTTQRLGQQVSQSFLPKDVVMPYDPMGVGRSDGPTTGKGRRKHSKSKKPKKKPTKQTKRVRFSMKK